MKLKPVIRSSLWFYTIVLNFYHVAAVLPSAKIDVISQSGVISTTFLASESQFGEELGMGPGQTHPMVPMFPPKDNFLLCDEVPKGPMEQQSSTPQVIIVGRGECTFEKKALAAQRLGADAMIIYGTLAARYSLNSTDRVADYVYTGNDIIFPTDKEDYDCDKARLEVPLQLLSFDPLPYNAAINDRQLVSTNEGGNMLLPSGASCPSNRAFLTGKTYPDTNPQTMEACCAWDLHVYLYADTSMSPDLEPVTIPAVYITMHEGHLLLNAIQSDSSLMLTLYRRYEPEYNISGVLIWGLGVFVAALSAYLSASEYRHAKNFFAKRSVNNNSPSDVVETSSIGPSDTGTRIRSKSPAKQNGDSTQNNRRMLENPDGTPQQQITYVSNTAKEEDLELTMGHAIGFVFFSSAGLLTLFFFKLYAVVKVFYAIGCSSAIMQVIFIPLYQQIMKKLKLRDRHLGQLPFDLGHISVVEFFALFTSYGLGIYWLTLSFMLRHPDTNVFYWIMQDVMGACMCITFLHTIKLNSIKVASALLIIAFFYDIFFVFVSPLLTKGRESIMITVATSGGPPKASPEWCEKYPDDKNCQGGDPLPMLFTIPRIFDYRGGSSLLGLGDIVLPGLLLSFAARFDEAKRLLGTIRGGSRGHPDSLRRNIFRKICCCCNGGYFAPVVVAYAVGLAMANAAVYLMNYGQPALLYLVPCCLGTIVFLGFRRGELKEFWETPKAIQAADSILHGEPSRSGLVTDSDDNFIDSEENVGIARTNASNGNGNAPLLNLT